MEKFFIVKTIMKKVKMDYSVDFKFNLMAFELV